MRKRTQHGGFALATGLMFLLVLTLIAIVAMQGTKLELAMTTAVTRQEQAFEMTELSRVVARQSQALSFALDQRVIKTNETNIPSFAVNAVCGVQLAGASQVGPGIIRGWNCSTGDCMSDRLQNMNAVADLWTIGYPACVALPDVADLRGSGGLIKLGVDNGPGRDSQAGQDEIPVLISAFGRGSTADGGNAMSMSFFTVKTSR